MRSDRRIDDEVGLAHLETDRTLGDAAVAFGHVLLRVVGELLPGVEQSTDASRIEALRRAGQTLVRFDTAAAVDRTPQVGVLEIGGVVRPAGILVTNRGAQGLVERDVPW